MPRVAAAIVHYGRAEPTLACLRALTESAGGVEAWVVDNGPPGALGEIDVAAGRRLTAERNLGYGAALNLVAGHLLQDERYDALLCLNNDALVDAETVPRLAATLTADARRAAAAPRIVLAESPGTLWYGGGEIDWRRGSARVPGAGGPATAPAALVARDVGFATGCALLLRLEALAAVGGFDERYFLYEEDVELSLRLRAAGWTLRYVPDAIVRHGGQAGRRSPGEPFVPIHRPENPRAAELAELQVCNRLLTMQRHAGRSHRLAFAAWFPLYWTARCLAAVGHGRFELAPAVWRGVRRYRELRRRPPATGLVASAARGEADGEGASTWSRS